MLSPHELATLMLVKASPERIEPDRMELDALCELQLIEIPLPPSGFSVPRVTDRGNAILRAISRAR
jgi:hypothetical protein